MRNVTGQEQERLQPGNGQQGDHHRRDGNNEFTDDAGHKIHGQEGRDGSHDGRGHRTQEFQGTRYRRIIGFESPLHVISDVLANDNGIIHQHPQYHDEPHHGDQVQGHPGAVKDKYAGHENNRQPPGGRHGHGKTQEQQQ